MPYKKYRLAVYACFVEAAAHNLDIRKILEKLFHVASIGEIDRILGELNVILRGQGAAPLNQRDVMRIFAIQIAGEDWL